MKTHETLIKDLAPTKFTKLGVIWTSFLVIVVVIGAIAYVDQLIKGQVVTNMRDYALWGIYISNFVFFVAVSLIGFLLSSALHLLKISWSKPISRVAEQVAIAGVALAGLIIIMDMGRPDAESWLLKASNGPDRESAGTALASMATIQERSGRIEAAAQSMHRASMMLSGSEQARARSEAQRLAKAVPLPVGASIKVVETPPGPPVLATLLAELEAGCSAPVGALAEVVEGTDGGHRGRVPGAHLDGQGTLAGRRKHLDGVEQLGGLIDAAQREQTVEHLEADRMPGGVGRTFQRLAEERERLFHVADAGMEGTIAPDRLDIRRRHAARLAILRRRLKGNSAGMLATGMIALSFVASLILFLHFDAKGAPQVVLLAGPQGVGKTTAAGKLAALPKRRGKKVLLEL